MAEPKHTLEEILTAINDTGGIKAMIANRLQVHRHTVDNYLSRYATAQQAYDEEVAKVGDMAEDVIIQAINKNDVETAKWYARMKLKERGYSERQEVTGKDGGPIASTVIVHWPEAEVE